MSQRPLDLTEVLVQNFNLEPEFAKTILNVLTENVIHYLVLCGCADTPFGKMKFGNKGVEIVEQNPALIKILSDSFDPLIIREQLEDGCSRTNGDSQFSS